MLQELRIEMSFPADDESDAILRRWETNATLKKLRVEPLSRRFPTRDART